MLTWDGDEVVDIYAATYNDEGGLADFFTALVTAGGSELMSVPIAVGSNSWHAAGVLTVNGGSAEYVDRSGRTFPVNWSTGTNAFGFRAEDRGGNLVDVIWRVRCR